MNAAKKKLGPLPLWQWILIGAALGIGTVLYRRGHPAATTAQNAVAAATPSDAAYNPIDPTTGLPISGGFSTGPSTTGDAATGQSTLADMLTNFGTLEGLLAGLSEINPGADPGAAVNTDQGAVATQTGTKKAAPKKKTPPKKKAKKTTHAGAKNPGHHVTAHGNGKRTASSSAPHNQRQHHNVQAPSHQRHDPTTHPSGHAVGRVTGTTHVTPAAHPPAKRAAPARRAAGKPKAAHPYVNPGTRLPARKKAKRR